VPLPGDTLRETIPAAKPPAPGPDGPRGGWTDHAARTTAVLAVLAAIASGQYAEAFSRTILAQTEASDAWSYYQAKSIKKYLAEGQHELAAALTADRPDGAQRLARLDADAAARSKRYDGELAEIKAKADGLDAAKRLHERRGARFQWAFLALQSGVVLSTIAGSSRRKELWFGALICGLAGAAMAANAYLLWF
jgi:hypothetical protein